VVIATACQHARQLLCSEGNAQQDKAPARLQMQGICAQKEVLGRSE